MTHCLCVALGLFGIHARDYPEFGREVFELRRVESRERDLEIALPGP